MPARHATRPVHARKVRQQRRLPGLKRLPIGASTERRIRAAVLREARRYRVSASFVIAVALAYALDVTLEANDSYKPQPFRVIRGGRGRG